jgi:signal peptide peptidase SppA
MKAEFARFAATRMWAMDATHMRAWARVIHGAPLAFSDKRAVASEEKAAAPGARAQKRAAGGVLVVPLLGVMSQRGGMSTCSSEEVAQTVASAANDPSVGAIVLEADTPGGEVSGTPELAAVIRQAAAMKVIVASVNSLAASAGYWAISGCTEILVTPSGLLGSIGIYTCHEDMSEALAADGVKLTFVSAGEGKTAGNPAEPLSEEARADLQMSVNEAYGMFTSAVAKGRGVGVEVVRSTWKAKVYGARQAVEMGMANAIGTRDDAIRRAASLSRRQAPPAAAEAEAIRLRRERA